MRSSLLNRRFRLGSCRPLRFQAADVGVDAKHRLRQRLTVNIQCLPQFGQLTRIGDLRLSGWHERPHDPHTRYGLVEPITQLEARSYGGKRPAAVEQVAMSGVITRGPQRVKCLLDTWQEHPMRGQRVQPVDLAVPGHREARSYDILLCQHLTELARVD